MELQHEMATAMISEAKALREASRVKRAEAQACRNLEKANSSLADSNQGTLFDLMETAV
jgi:hypothetical protein